MADHQDESRSTTNSLNNEGEAGSSNSRDLYYFHEEKDHKDWLQLSIGNQKMAFAGKDKISDNRIDTAATRRTSAPVELDLLPPGGGSEQSAARPAPIFFPTFTEFRDPRRPFANATGAATDFNAPLAFQHNDGGSTNNFPAHHFSPSGNLWMPLMGSYFSRPYQLPTGRAEEAGASSSSSSEIKVIDAPRRSYSGVWFMLQASEYQAKEPFLPQIPKSYLRNKDGRMTIRLLMKYIVNKLKLDKESEIEIRCRGQELLPFLTLQHVRDNIWSRSKSRREAEVTVAMLPADSSDHVMVLNYGRSA